MKVRELAAMLLALPDDVQDMPVTTIVVSGGLWYTREDPEIRVIRHPGDEGDETASWDDEAPFPRVEIE